MVNLAGFNKKRDCTARGIKIRSRCMKRAVLSLLSTATLVLCAEPATAQDWQVSRFDRITLRNGNFIDGQLIRNLDYEVVIALSFGRMTIRRDQILKIERITIRSIEEKPEEIPIPVDNPPRIDPFDKPLVPITPPEDPTSTSPSSTHPTASNAPVDAILGRLRRTRGSRKEDVAKMLVPLGPGAARYLAGKLPDLNVEIRDLVGDAIGEIKDPGSIPILRRHLKHRDPEVRLTTLRTIGQIGGKDTAKVVRPFLDDSDSIVLLTVLDILGQLGDTRSMGRIAALARSPERNVRSRALGALGTIARDNNMEDRLQDLLVSIMDRTRGEVKADIVLSLANLKSEDLWEEFTSLLRDDAPEVRAAAANTLINMRDRRRGPAIVDQIGQERVPFVRVKLAVAAERLNLRGAIEDLIGWLESDEIEVRRAAQDALKKLTRQRFGADVEKWLEWWEKTRR